MWPGPPWAHLHLPIATCNSHHYTINLLWATYTKNITCSVVILYIHHRLSMQNLQSFSERVLHNIQTSDVPKVSRSIWLYVECNIANTESYLPTICIFPTQYRIFLASALQWLGLCGSVVRKMGNRRVSVSTMAILKEPLLNTHFDDSFDDSFDVYTTCIHSACNNVSYR